MSDALEDIIIEKYEDMSREDLIACCYTHDAHHEEHHAREAALQRPEVEGEFQKQLKNYSIKDGWFHVNTIDEMQAFYLSRLPAIREAAKSCGYAIGVHGSERRDFDLIAMPWIEKPSSPDELAKAIHNAACGITNSKYIWEQKPNGRIAVSIPICWCNWHDMVSAGHIDLSVMSSKGHLTAQPVPDGLVLVPSEYIDAMEELIEVAQLRGDQELPHPADDEKLWTARMQDAWGDAIYQVENLRTPPKQEDE